MIVATYKCDVCGKQKGDVNHWWIVRSAEYGDNYILTMTDWNERALSSPFDLQGRALKNKKESHLCGAECVQRKVNEFMNQVSR